MASYKAKTAYKGKEIAEAYDEIRFTSPQGKYLDKVEKHAIRHLMKQMDKHGLVLDLASGSGRFAKLALLYS